MATRLYAQAPCQGRTGEKPGALGRPRNLARARRAGRAGRDAKARPGRVHRGQEKTRQTRTSHFEPSSGRGRWRRWRSRLRFFAYARARGHPPNTLIACRQSQFSAVIPFESRRSPEPWDGRCDGAPEQAANWLMRRKVKTLKAVRHGGSSVDSQETEVARLNRELDDAWEQQTATAEALKIISTSPTELRTSASPPRSVDVQVRG